MGRASTYVLIPGAWHGGWAWRPVAERLRAAGHRAICLTLPGLGDGDDPTGLRLQDAVDHVVGEVERLNLDRVILVGHSVAEDAQRLLAELLTPQPGRYFADALDVPDMITLGIPTRYILSADDRAAGTSAEEHPISDPDAVR